MSTLTTVKGANRTNIEATPPVQAPSKESYGRIRVLYDSYTLATGDNFGTSGLIRLMTIPQNAKLHQAFVKSPDLGTTGIFDVGWAAGATGDEAADADGIFVGSVSCDAGGQAIGNWMTGATPGFAKTFSEAVEVQMDFSEASAGSGSRVISLTLLLSVD